MSPFIPIQQRVPRNNVPLLVVGLGGTGTDALLHVMSLFKQRFELPIIDGKVSDTPLRTAYFAIDTDDCHLRTASQDGMCFDPSNRYCLNHASNFSHRSAYVQEWWDDHIPDLTSIIGTGGIRQVGRLLLFENADHLVFRLKNVIQNLIQINSGELSRTLDIVLAAGISGGTGSGTFLDMAYLLRYLMKTYFPGVEFSILAYLIMPAVNIRRILHPALHPMLEANGYAALKELDFWMNDDQHRPSFTQKYSEYITYTWSTPPFDNVVLLDDSTSNGYLISHPYESSMQLISSSLLHFFSEPREGLKNSPFGFPMRVYRQRMKKKAPGNYCYMSMGASNFCKHLLYEAKCIFEQLMKLNKLDADPLNGNNDGAKPILGTNEEMNFLEAVLPRGIHYYADFSGLCPLPDFFTDPALYPPATLHSMLGDEALHAAPLREYMITSKRTITEELPRKMQELWARFEQTTRKYLTDPEFGPFSVLKWLTEPANGFVARFYNFVEFWQSEAYNLNTEINTQTARVEGTLYTDMVGLSRLQQTLGMWGKVEDYRAGAGRLYKTKRDHLVAVAFRDGFVAMEKRIANYAHVVLPAFCDMLSSLHRELTRDEDRLLATTSASKAAVKGSVAGVLALFADATFDAEADTTGTVKDINNIRQTLFKKTQIFLANNSKPLSIDQLVEYQLPGSTYGERVNYIANTLLPDLNNRAKTSLELNPRPTTQALFQSHVSLPSSQPLLHASFKQYAASLPASAVSCCFEESDCVFWLNTCCCLNLTDYFRLSHLKQAYEQILKMSLSSGIHLVYKQNADDLEHNWLLLPSPTN